MERPQFVFGYGSLLARAETGGSAVLCELAGYRRTWNVAMDNSKTIPGYKHYIDAVSGEREAWFVTFLNIVADETARVNGVLFEVDDALLRRLDRRERNYQRIDVSAELANCPDGEVWAYAGSPDAARRFQFGQSTNRAVISREYYEGVRDDFGSLGEVALARFDELTDEPSCPILDLRRIDHPPAAARAVCASTGS